MAANNPQQMLAMLNGLVQLWHAALAVDPCDPQRIFAGTFDTTGAHVSADQARGIHTRMDPMPRLPQA